MERSQRITVRVRPYDSDGLAVGPWREASLAERTKVRSVLAGFSLLDADGSSQGLLAALTDGATVELADPDGGSYAIRAELVEGELAGSVHLELTGTKRGEVHRKRGAVPAGGRRGNGPARGLVHAEGDGIRRPQQDVRRAGHPGGVVHGEGGIRGAGERRVER